MQPAASSVRSLVDELLAPDYPGVPAIVLFKDYRQREQLSQALVHEANLHDVTLHVFSQLGDATERLPTLSAERDDAALALLDVSNTQDWGRWLEATRERLPEWVRFLVVMVAREEIPTLARQAPGFLSWAKSQVIERLLEDEPSVSDVAAEFEEIQRQTGLTPKEFVQAWCEGRLHDTYRNSAWLNLAEAILDTEEDNG
ncbi:MAG TPA: hypothetical protein VE057_04730 [Archangium sp.]|nr:hypothetical protein [Archangium sp.]